jgi:very-long-chain (3R)-3-hydroxyacyl-CoA dehydratase
LYSLTNQPRGLDDDDYVLCTQISGSVFVTLVLVWSMADMIRYAYYATLISVRSRNKQESASLLQWLRYSAFILLYPIGVLSEISLIVLAIPILARTGKTYPLALACAVPAYVPGLYMLYTYMLRQRKKVLGSDPKVYKKKD